MGVSNVLKSFLNFFRIENPCERRGGRWVCKRDRKNGSKKRQLTIRALVVGVCVGFLMCATNTYFGLQTGWVTMGSLQSTLLGFLTFKIISALSKLLCESHQVAGRGRWYFAPLTAEENVVLQTTAVATATMPLAGGFVGIVPALTIMQREAQEQVENGTVPEPGSTSLYSVVVVVQMSHRGEQYLL